MYLHCVCECVSNVESTSDIWWRDDNGEGRLVTVNVRLEETTPLPPGLHRTTRVDDRGHVWHTSYWR